MRKDFEKTLKGNYGDIAKKKTETEESSEVSPEEEQELETVLNWHLRQEAEKRLKTIPGGDKNKTERREALIKEQGEIFDIQKEKQELIKWLKEERAKLNDPEYRPEKEEGAKEVVFGGGKYYCEHNGKLTEVSYADLMTDGIWGINYFLDPQTVSKSVRKKFILESTRDKLYDLLDDQIYADEGTREDLHEWKQQAYVRSQEDKESGIEKAGIIAEKAVYGFLRRISIGLDVDFKVLRADIFEDVEHKIDFILHRKKRMRGVDVETIDDKDESVDNLGIQFTINTREDVLKKKGRQVKRVKEHIDEFEDIEDLVLVSVPIKTMMNTYNEWKDEDRPTGGPESLWSKEVKQRVLAGVLEGFISEEEINKLAGEI